MQSALPEKIKQILEEMRNIQVNLLEYLEDESNDDELFQNLKQIFDEIKLNEDEHKLMSLLRLLLKIANNHHRDCNFFDKIEKIIQIFHNDIKKYYSNSEIFNIFKSNKRILLFLIEQKLMVMDEYIVKKIIQRKYVKFYYPQYFLPEILPFKDKKWLQESFSDDLPKELIEEIKKGELPVNFYNNRKIGENDNLICKFIREDSVQEFIAYVNRHNTPLNSEISPSIYETNPFLIKNLLESKEDSKLTLIKYAAFFGSIQIVQYLQMNNVKLTPSLWLFAIHGKNNEMIHRLEDNHINPMIFYNDGDVDMYEKCFKESIKCHHNEIANYIQINLMRKENLQKNFIHSLKNYNFLFIQGDLIDKTSLYSICKYGYYLIAYYIIMNDNDININKILVKLFNIIKNQVIQ